MTGPISHLGIGSRSRVLRFRDDLAATREHADALAVSLFNTNATGLVVTRMNEHHVRCIDETFGLDDSAFARATSARLEVSLLKTYAFNTNTALRRIDGDNSALCIARRTGSAHNLDQVATSNFLHAGLPASGQDGRVESAYVSAIEGLSSRTLGAKNGQIHRLKTCDPPTNLERAREEF